MLRMILVVVVLAASCRNAPPVPEEPLVAADRPDVPPTLAEANEAFREYLRVSQLGLIPAEAQQDERVLRGLMRWKTNVGRDVAAPFEAALTRGVDPDVAEFALLRLGVLQLNLGCEVSSLVPPAHLPADRQQIFDDMLDETGMRLIEQADEYLASADGLRGRRNNIIERLRAALPAYASDVRTACRQTAEAWKSPDKASLDDVASRGCDDGEGALCWVWAKWGSGGEDALAAACEDDLAAACVEVADRKVVFSRPQSNPTAAEEAEQLYARACKLGHTSACRKELAVFVPARRDAYRTACLANDDPIACYKLTRVLTLDADVNPLWWSCTSRDEQDQDPPATCKDDHAFACATKAGAAAVDAGYLVQLEDVEPAVDASKAALECGEGDDDACRRGARAFASTANWGCSTALLIEACSRGKTELCGFHHGP